MKKRDFRVGRTKNIKSVIRLQIHKIYIDNQKIHKTSRSDAMSLAVCFNARVALEFNCRRVSDDWTNNSFNRRWRDEDACLHLFRALKHTAKLKPPLTRWKYYIWITHRPHKLNYVRSYN